MNRDGKDWLNRVLWRLIEDGASYRVQKYQDEWEVNFEARMCIAHILQQWKGKAA